MTYGPPPPGYPPEYPRATSSPPIIVLVSGLAALLGFLLGVFVGFGAAGTGDGADAGPEPAATVTVEDTEPPAPDPSATPPPATDPPATDPSATDPGATQPGATGPPATDPGATGPAATEPGVVPSGGASAGTGVNPASLRTLVVGRDIQPGTYRTSGPTSGFSMCFWARMRSATAGLDDVITSGMPTGPATVTVQPTDKAFSTGGCVEWTRA
ncbi:hypothetical protein Nocox_16140 [Nonomuraea coxensis DSM 45129]|uniref:Uncharacterized protein n=1 Tax=Nonomuraea coxensis DSM 45129 TaxID=1122611 RepID=A0ABX8U2H1_9ACTN|nr:hypothetical protein [Nonomuraea coxensis]QYC40842.1 hypothetical protein Nocox_16140 [Nonomuraea coxensis DSM 45129]